MDKIATDFTVHVSPVLNHKPTDNSCFLIGASEIIDGSHFTVYGNAKQKFTWMVMGKRGEIDVEPLRKDTDVRGDGPYRYIV